MPVAVTVAAKVKKEVLDQSQQIRRQQVPPEYLKEVVVRYILSNPVSKYGRCAKGFAVSQRSNISDARAVLEGTRVKGRAVSQR